MAERTDELATFFDLTLLAGQAADLSDIFEQVLTRIMEVTRSRALCIHLFDAEHTALDLAGQQNLAGDAAALLHTAPLEAGFARWLQQANDPLVTTDLAALAILPGGVPAPGLSDLSRRADQDRQPDRGAVELLPLHRPRLRPRRNRAGDGAGRATGDDAGNPAAAPACRGHGRRGGTPAAGAATCTTRSPSRSTA